MYDVYLQKWKRHASEWEMDSVSPSLAEGVNFMATLVQDKTSLSAVCTAQSALSCFLCKYEGVTFCIMTWYDGSFKQNPTFHKQLKEPWNVNIVLTMLNTWMPLDKLTLKELTLKLVMLTALLLGQRCLTLHALDTAHMSLMDKKCAFFVNSVLKHTRRGALIKLQLNLLP